jgi:type I restriction enzyme S subunit
MAREELVGALPTGWEYTTLGEVCARGGGNVQTGPFGSQLHAADYVSRGVPSIMPQNIGDNRVVREGIAQITVEDAERLNRYRVRPGDVVHSRRGDVERRALIRDAEDGWLCGTGCLRVRFGDGHVNPTFASYYLGDPNVREWVVRHAHGATMPNLNTAILSALPFVLPPLSEQRAIAHILGTLDDKIELNRRMNETLEAMARALFKSWFVDFDPVRAEAEGHDPGLPKHLANLFPNSFEDSAVGEIPKGWAARAWGALVTLEYGRALRGYDRQDGAYPVYGTNGRIGTHTEALCPHPGVIIGRKGAYRGVHYCDSPFFAIDTAFYLAPRAAVELRWAYYELLRQDINSMDSGSAIPSTSREDFCSLPVVAPPPDVQRAFVKVLDPAWRRQRANIEEVATLAALRDTLLLKLISGEIRVKDADKFLERIA